MQRIHTRTLSFQRIIQNAYMIIRLHYVEAIDAPQDIRQTIEHLTRELEIADRGDDAKKAREKYDEFLKKTVVSRQAQFIRAEFIDVTPSHMRPCMEIPTVCFTMESPVYNAIQREMEGIRVAAAANTHTLQMWDEITMVDE
jgi:hypothetical protein